LKVTFKKQRYYKSVLHKVGDTINMDYKHARAFLRVHAVIPTIIQATAKPKKQAPVLKKPILVRTAPPKASTAIATPIVEAKPPEDDKVEIEQLPIISEDVKEETVVEEVEEEEVEEFMAEDAIDFENISYRELQELCKAVGVSASGAKVELIARLQKGA